MRKLLNTEPKQLDELIQFLESLGIKTEVYNPKEIGFNREIKFELNGITFILEWWKNQCYIKINDVLSYPFKYIVKDTTYPHSGKWIKFSDKMYSCESMLDSPFDFDCLRIKYN